MNMIRRLIFLAAFIVTAFVAQNARAVEPLRIAIAHSFRDDFLPVQELMQTRYHVEFSSVYATAKGKGGSEENPSRVTNLDELHKVDVILSNFYRTWIPPDQMESVKKAFRTKPVVGIRKANHGFQNWLEFDSEVFGMDYRGHHGGRNHRIAAGQEKNPLVAGFDPIEPDGGYYGHRDFADDVTPLLVITPGKKGNDDEVMPQTFLRVNKETGQRSFYTRYGPESVKNHESVRDLVVHALFWAADKDERDYRK